MSSSGLTRSIHRPHQQRQIARRRLGQQFLVHIPDAPDGGPVHSTRIELMREVPFDFLPPLPLHPLAPLSPNAPPVAIHRSLFCLLAIPVARSPIWFRDVSPYPQVAQADRNLIAVVSLVRHHFFHSTTIHPILASRRFP